LLASIEAFLARYGYDASYMKEILAASPEALSVFNGFLPMASFRRVTPLNVYFTAKLAAFKQVDCGPCLELSVKMAKESGLDPQLIRDILNPAVELPPLLQMVRAFSNAVLQGSADVDELRLQLLTELGEAVMAELALAIAAPQIFPAVKRALGHYQSCALTPLEI